MYLLAVNMLEGYDTEALPPRYGNYSVGYRHRREPTRVGVQFPLIPLFKNKGTIFQLAENSAHNRKVIGSSPICSTRRIISIEIHHQKLYDNLKSLLPY